MDELEYHHRIARTPGVTLVYFTAPSCASCHALKRALTRMLEEGDALTVYEVDAGRNMGLVRELDVFHLPALFVYVGGEYHCALHSEPLCHRLRANLAEALRAPSQEAP
jgi:thioredoxin 1